MSFTLLPYKGYMQSASVLSDLHLLNQCDAVVSILGGKCNDTPLPGMWKGHLYQLVLFGMSHCHVARIGRGLRWSRWEDIGRYLPMAMSMPKDRPPWWGDQWVHRSHRSRLLNLTYGQYHEYFPGNSMKMPMIWPELTDEDSRGYRLTLSVRDQVLVRDKMLFLPPELAWNGKELVCV